MLATSLSECLEFKWRVSPPMKPPGVNGFLHACLAVTCVAILVEAQCHSACERVRMSVPYGFDAAYRSVQVDIGNCTSNTAENCSSGENQSDCLPDSYELRQFNNRSGPFLARVIKSCQSMGLGNAGCQKVEVPTVVFPQSPFQKTIKTGACYGRCIESGCSCLPTHERTVVAHGPNGPVPIINVLNCGCVEDAGYCYRADHFESHWELVATTTDNVTTAVALEKLINVGKCVGSCPPARDRCYPSDEDCWLRIPSPRLKCVPRNAILHTFFNLSGMNVTVAAVDQCDCLTG